jgi:hypothetical protein
MLWADTTADNPWNDLDAEVSSEVNFEAAFTATTIGDYVKDETHGVLAGTINEFTSPV